MTPDHWLAARLAAARNVADSLGGDVLDEAARGLEPGEGAWALLLRAERALVEAFEAKGAPPPNIEAVTPEAAWIRARLEAALDVLGEDHVEALRQARDAATGGGPWGALLAVERMATERLGIGVRT